MWRIRHYLHKGEMMEFCYEYCEGCEHDDPEAFRCLIPTKGLHHTPDNCPKLAAFYAQNVEPLVLAERERCAKIAAELCFEQAPDFYQVTAPELEGLCGDWQRQQGYHADRIAEVIREQDGEQ